MKHGSITTEQIRDLYGYTHPPRAIRDVREHGIPLETFRVKDSDGRNISAYRFGDPSQERTKDFSGRKAWPKDFKKKLIDTYGSKCGVCNIEFEDRYLQIDHRVPYAVAGEFSSTEHVNGYMLLCGSCNRAKAWSCEHCRNCIHDRIIEVCQTCYWAHPLKYEHIALRLIRRLDITWTEQEIREHDQLLELSKDAQIELPEYVKNVLRNVLKQEL